MKRITLPTFAAAGLLATSGVFAQTSASEHTGASIHAVAESELRQHVTLSTMIGKTVVDQNQETVGTLRDVDLSQTFGDPATSASAPMNRISLMVAAEGADDLVAIDARQVTFDRTNDRVVVTLPVASDEPAGATIPGSDALASRATETDGGTTKGQVAPADVAANDPANTIEPVAVAAVPGSNVEVATTGEDVIAVEQALASSEQTRDVADQITVMSSDEAIVLTGQIHSEEKRRHIVEVAREAAQDREVRDLMDVAAE